MTRPTIGLVAGVVVAIVWAALGLGAALLAIVLGGLGYLVGLLVERPEALIAVLERLQER